MIPDLTDCGQVFCTCMLASGIRPNVEPKTDVKVRFILIMNKQYKVL